MAPIGFEIRCVIIGPAGSGKSTLAHRLAQTANPPPIIYDDPAPAMINLRGTWIYVAQSVSDVPAEVVHTATIIYRSTGSRTFVEQSGVEMNVASPIATLS